MDFNKLNELINIFNQKYAAMKQENKSKNIRKIKKYIKSLKSNDDSNVLEKSTKSKQSDNSKVSQKIDHLLSFCPTSLNDCVSIGDNKMIHDIFKLFQFFNTTDNITKIEKLSSSTGANSFVYKILRQNDINNSIVTFLKTPKRVKGRENTDSLLYEYFVGDHLNSFTRTPNLVKTVNLLYIENNDYFTEINTLGALTVPIIKESFDPINQKPINFFFNKLESIILETMYANNSINLLSKLQKNNNGVYDLKFYETDLWKILLQLFAFLHIHQYVFTHYDLHLNNIMLIQIPNKKMKFVYGKEPYHAISFESKYLVKIIDYGRVYLRQHTDMFRDIMKVSNVKNLQAFSFLINQRNRKNYETYRYRYITSYKRNKSYDLQSLVYIRELYNHRKSVNNDETALRIKTNFLNKVQYYHDQKQFHGTPELEDSLDNTKINTVEDAYIELKNTILPVLDRKINDTRFQLLCTYTIDTTVILNDDKDIHLPFGFEMSKSHKGK